MVTSYKKNIIFVRVTFLQVSTEREKSRMKRTGVGAGHQEKMICVECFRTKGDGDLKLPCQNPRCHFYLSTSTSNFSTSKGSTYPSVSNAYPSFNKEVGYDRKAKYSPSPQKSTADYNGGCPGQISVNEKAWKNQPLGPGLLSVPHTMPVQKTRSKSTSTTNTTGGNTRLQKLLSGYPAPLLLNKDGGKKYLHSRMMSLPEYTDSFLGGEGRGDLVEDAFVASPLLVDYGERVDEDRVRWTQCSFVTVG